MAAKRKNQWNSTTEKKRKRLINDILCEICNCPFKTLNKLKFHQIDNHKGNQWRCSICTLEMKFSRSDLGRYTHFCESKVVHSKRSRPAPSNLTALEEFR